MKAKFFGLLALAAMSLFAFAGTASATITPGPPSALSASGTDIALDTFIDCDSELSGFVANSYGAGLGGDGYITDGSFFNCGFGKSTTDYLDPNDSSTWWKISAVPDPNDSDLSYVTVENIKVTVNVLGVVCTYEGTLSGTGSDANDTITLSNAGGLTRTSGEFPCPTNPNTNGTYTFDQDIEVS